MSDLTPEDFDLLLQANRILSSKLDVEDLLQSVMELAGRVVRAEAASILLLDEKTDELYFNVALGEVGASMKQIRLKVGEGLAGWVARHKEPAIVNDVKGDARWSGKGDEKSDFNTRQILAVPLVAKGRLIGVVEAINREDGSPFTDHHLKTFEAFASQAAVAIENAQLFAEVKGEKEKLATLFEEMSDGAVMLDGTGRVQLMNVAAGHLLGTEPAKVVAARTPVKELTKDFMAVPPVDMVIERGLAEASVELKRREGKAFYLSCTVNRLTDAEGKPVGFLLVLRDVTDLRKEEMLKRNFLSLISHKLKTPLVTIAGYAPLLLEEPNALNEFQKKALHTIKAQGMHLSSLVDKLINFSLVESETLDLETKPLSLKAVLDEAVGLMKPYLDGHGARYEEDPGLAKLPKVSVDGERVREVFRNLIENAVKFNPKPDKKVRVSAGPEGDRVRVTVQDNGPGIPPEEKPRIFQKFYQIEESFTGQVEGAGLGLALVRRIVEAHNGAFGVEDAPGGGSAFFFTLPSAKP